MDINPCLDLFSVHPPCVGVDSLSTPTLRRVHPSRIDASRGHDVHVIISFCSCRNVFSSAGASLKCIANKEHSIKLQCCGLEVITVIGFHKAGCQKVVHQIVSMVNYKLNITVILCMLKVLPSGRK